MWADFSTALTVGACLLSLVACWFAARTAIRQRVLLDHLRDLSLSHEELRSHSGSAKLQSRLDELEQTVEVLANRVKMQKVRNAALHVQRDADPGLPDPYKDPDGWRRAMNTKLGLGKLAASQRKE